MHGSEPVHVSLHLVERIAERVAAGINKRPAASVSEPDAKKQCMKKCMKKCKKEVPNQKKCMKKCMKKASCPPILTLGCSGVYRQCIPTFCGVHRQCIPLKCRSDDAVFTAMLSDHAPPDNGPPFFGIQAFKKPQRWFAERPNGCGKCRGVPGCTPSCWRRRGLL